MIFEATDLPGAFVITPELHADGRGFFARTYCRDEFKLHGIDFDVVQCNVSFNARSGTLRGMHYQAPPKAEAKLIACTCGAVYDVIIDLGRGSETPPHWFGVELSAENHKMLFVPEGFAHGFQTLQDNTTMFYQMSEFYSCEHACGVRWDDPAFGIDWPLNVTSISDKDRMYPDFKP